MIIRKILKELFRWKIDNLILLLNWFLDYLNNLEIGIIIKIEQHV